jgi:hypothetical protein
MPEPGLTKEEHAQLNRLLHDSRDRFLEVISGLTDAQWTCQAAPGCWSVQQIAEHLVLGETAMLAKIDQALAAPPHPDWREQDARKTAFIGRVLPDRSRKANAPATLEPNGRWTREETAAHYTRSRTRTLQFVEGIDRPVKEHLAEHPLPVFNMLNVYHWLLYIPLHNVRHNQQIAEAISEIGGTLSEVKEIVR